MSKFYCVVEIMMYFLLIIIHNCLTLVNILKGVLTCVLELTFQAEVVLNYYFASFQHFFGNTMSILCCKKQIGWSEIF